MVIVRILNNDGVKGARMNIAERRVDFTGEVERFGSPTNSDKRLRC